jgi:hypothetical protein
MILHLNPLLVTSVVRCCERIGVIICPSVDQVASRSLCHGVVLQFAAIGFATTRYVVRVLQFVIADPIGGMVIVVRS